MIGFSRRTREDPAGRRVGGPVSAQTAQLRGLESAAPDPSGGPAAGRGQVPGAGSLGARADPVPEPAPGAHGHPRGRRARCCPVPGDTALAEAERPPQHDGTHIPTIMAS